MMNGPQKIRDLIGGEWVNGDGGDVRSLDPADPDGAAVAAYRAVTEEQIDAGRSGRSGRARVGSGGRSRSWNDPAKGRGHTRRSSG